MTASLREHDAVLRTEQRAPLSQHLGLGTRYPLIQTWMKESIRHGHYQTLTSPDCWRKMCNSMQHRKHSTFCSYPFRRDHLRQTVQGGQECCHASSSLRDAWLPCLTEQVRPFPGNGAAFWRCLPCFCHTFDGVQNDRGGAIFITYLGAKEVLEANTTTSDDRTLGCMQIDIKTTLTRQR